MNTLAVSEFAEIDYQELDQINGGALGFGMICLIVAGVTVKCAWYAFLAGCAYELLLG